jgi:hypothetical protein
MEPKIIKLLAWEEKLFSIIQRRRKVRKRTALERFLQGRFF